MDYGHPVRFGVFITPVAQPEHSLAVAVLADELGFDLIGLQDHPYQSRFLDAWTLLTAMAMRTKRIAVFPDVANVPLRPPAILAKAAASLDLLTGGRVELGLGAGGSFDAIKAIGGPMRSRGGRGRGWGGAGGGDVSRACGGGGGGGAFFEKENPPAGGGRPGGGPGPSP